MTQISIGKKILLHLDRFRNVDSNDKYNIPWDLTQDGIATSLRISRAHASIELKKLRSADLVEEKQAHIKGGKVKRKAYFLSPQGFENAGQLRTSLEKDGVDIKALLDFKRQDADALMENLTEEETYALGCACAFRVPVPLSEIPKTIRSVVPSDVSGMTFIDPLLREKFLGAADPEALRTWHSFAADYWVGIDSKGLGDMMERIHERLYHLVEAGRTREASRLVSANVYDLIASANDDLMETMQKIDIAPAQQAADVYSVRFEADLQGEDFEDAEKTLEMLAGFDKKAADIYSADLMAAKGDVKAALSALAEMQGDIRADLRRASILLKDGKADEAESLVSDVAGRMLPGDTVSSTERFIILARIDASRGRKDDARMKLMKAKASTPDRDKKRIDLIISELGL